MGGGIGGEAVLGGAVLGGTTVPSTLNMPKYGYTLNTEHAQIWLYPQH